MTTQANKWTKSELKTYILLLCANADSQETKEELELIKSKTNSETFTKMYALFSKDTQDEGLQKIADNMQSQDYSNLELGALRKEIHEVFFSDGQFMMMEQNLERILDNIVY